MRDRIFIIFFFVSFSAFSQTIAPRETTSLEGDSRDYLTQTENLFGNLKKSSSSTERSKDLPAPGGGIHQLEFTSSNLPIVVINTEGRAIVDDPKVRATIGIIYNGEGIPNTTSDPFNEYEGHCGIEVRGESSQWFDKLSYGFEMWDALGIDMDTSFLNFPSEEDFILYGPYSDKSLLNNVLAMKLARDLGHYSSRTRLVELILNQEYQGVYVIMEKVKRDNDRVDIANLEPTDIEGDQLTGGYIFKIDKGDYAGWFSKYNVYRNYKKIFFQFYYPDGGDIQPEQKQYIKNYIDEFEDALASPSYRNRLGNHYSQYIDLQSFVDNLILNELSKNVDAYRLSTYFHKDKDSKGGKLKVGPYWDYNLAFGNADYCDGDVSHGWEYYQCTGNSPFWWNILLNDTTFTNALRCRWEDLRANKLHTDTISTYLDSMSHYLSDAQRRNFQRWQVMGTYVWPNSWFYASATSHEQVMGLMKDWIRDRLQWLDANLPGKSQYCDQYESPFEIPSTGLTTSLDPKPEVLTVYPNPASEVLIVQGSETIEAITIFNTLWQVVLTENSPSKQIEVDVRSVYPKGIYILSVLSANGTTIYKIMLE